MSNSMTANGGWDNMTYQKDGETVSVAFHLVNNRRTMTSYATIWIDGAKVSGTGRDVAYGDKRAAFKAAHESMVFRGYAKA